MSFGPRADGAPRCCAALVSLGRSYRCYRTRLHDDDHEAVDEAWDDVERSPVQWTDRASDVVLTAILEHLDKLQTEVGTLVARVIGYGDAEFLR